MYLSLRTKASSFILESHYSWLSIIPELIGHPTKLVQDLDSQEDANYAANRTLCNIIKKEAHYCLGLVGFHPQD